MSEHTRTPWKVRQTRVDLQEIYSADGESIATCWDIDEGVDSEANARHIVHCVNNYNRLVEALRNLEHWAPYDMDCTDEARALLAELERQS